jgi:YcaO-like protein with predicted kinase domain
MSSAPSGEHVGKHYFRGTHRTVSPRETLERVRPFLPAMGITRLANVTGLDTIGIPVVMACRPNSRSLSVAQGKGCDLDAAKASAAMETIESYHAERITLPLKLASYEELRIHHRAADVGRLPMTTNSIFHRRLPMLWVEGDDWLQRDRVWVPFQLVHTAYTKNMRFDLTSFVATSTGLASGNHLFEAVSHAICEIVERDADVRFSLLNEEEQQKVQIDLSTVDDPDCRELLARCDRAGVAVAVWDITSHVGLAAFHCLIADREDDPIRPLHAARGMGCHPVREIAFLRALTEAAQSRLTAISGSRDDMPHRDYENWRRAENLAMQRQFACRRGSRAFSEVPSRNTESFEQDLREQLELLLKAGCDRVVVFDLTMREFHIPVVRVVIPGMQIEGGRGPTEHSL